MQTKNNHLKKILVKSSKRKVFINTQDIFWIESSGNYVVLNLLENSYLIRGSLKDIQKKLNPSIFIRVHRSIIVNTNMIKYIESWFSGDFKIILKNGKDLRMSRRYKDNLDKFEL